MLVEKKYFLQEFGKEMGSSSKKHSKSVSSKARCQHTNDKSKKRRRQDVSSASSDDYSSSTDSEDNHKLQKKKNKKVKWRSKRSPRPEARRLRNEKKFLKPQSRSVERRKIIRKKRKVSSSSYSCSTCSEQSDRSGDERVFRKRRKLEPEQLGAESKRKRRGRSPSRSFSSYSTYSRSSCEPPKQVGSIDSAARKIEESKIGQSYRSENNAETIQSYNDYPSSRSNESNDNGGQVRQMENGNCSKFPSRTNNSDDLAEIEKSETDDQVEAQLRQKALENLAKFRFRHIATTKESRKLKEEGVATPNVEKFESNEPVRPPRIKSVVVVPNANNELPPVEAGGKVLTGEPSRSEVDQDQHATNAPESVSQTDNSIRVDEPRASAPEPSLPVNNKGEADGGTQLQQKTMTVMRGGELVQVTYKVHIPKTTPALARRRLQR